MQSREILENGGPEGYIRALAPRLLPLFPGPWSLEIVAADTTAAWVTASERVAQCAKCPTYGGACEGSLSVVPEGHTVSVPAGVLEYQPCGKWSLWSERQRLRHVGIPEALLDWPLDRLLPTDGYPARDKLWNWILLARTGELPRPPSFLMTGGLHVTRTRLAAAIARELAVGKRSVHYTFAPRLAAELKDHFDKSHAERDESPIERCEEADILVCDFVDPVPKGRDPWAPWFLSRMDTMLWRRLSSGKPTVLVSRARRDELWRHFEYSAAFTLDELDVASSSFGPVSDS